MNSTQKKLMIQQYGSSTVIDKLEPYITEHRKQRINNVLSGRVKGVQLALEYPSDINNALAAVRSSEAFGISTVHIICPEADVRFARGITQGAIYWLEVIFYESRQEFLLKMQAENIFLVGGTLNETSIPLAEVPIDRPMCIVIGNEHRGLSLELQQACDMTYKIPMYGMTESFNLSVSAAISLYDMTSRKRIRLGRDSDLTTEERQKLKAEFYLNSVAPRLAEALLKS